MKRVKLVLALTVSLLACTSASAENAVSPGAIEPHPTWACMGINWYFEGDENRNASVTVSYRRQGTDVWREAMPLWRHEFEQTLMFSGSIFRLAPGTAYEFKLSLLDPDGGEQEKTVTASTFDYPRMPETVIDVPSGGLAEAQRMAKPGSVLLLHKGTYQATELFKSGEPGRWIVYRDAGDGEVIINGKLIVSGQHIWLHGLTIQNIDRDEDWYNTLHGDKSSESIVVTNCQLKGKWIVHTPDGAAKYFVADNYIEGETMGVFQFTGEGVDFGEDAGRCGHAVCFNEFTKAADAVSYGSGNIDVYNNYIHDNVDDFVEMDYAHENYRVWNNRCYNSMSGFSWQPMRGGPWYVFNNLAVGAYSNPLKVFQVSGPTVLVNNTILSKSFSARVGKLMRGTIENNAWLRVPRGSVGSVYHYSSSFSPTQVDHNAYGIGRGAPFAGDYSRVSAREGWDEESVTVDYRTAFEEPLAIPTGSPHYRKSLHGTVIPDDWKFDHNMLIPQQDSNLVDAGIAFPNLTGPYLGSVPDIGAHEVGLGTAWYGPRVWDDEANLTYGLPKDWIRVPPKPSNNSNERMRLESQDGEIRTILRVELLEGKARWKRASSLVESAAGALTPPLAFQDGLYIRLYENRIVVARVEPEGVLHVESKGSIDAIRMNRKVLFQFARSFVQ